MSLGSHRVLRRRLAAAGTLGVLALASVAATAPGAAAGAGETEATTNFSAPCVLGPGILNFESTFDISTRAQQPAGVATGEEFSFGGASITLKGPAELSELFRALGAARVEGKVLSFPALVTNALPAGINLADDAPFPEGLPFQAAVAAGAELAFTAPSEARTTSWGPLTVTGEVGQDVRLALSTAAGFTEVEPEVFKASGAGIIASISGYGAEGTKVVGPLKLVCSAPVPTTLAEAPITGATPRITSITPDSGSALGGTTVTITGSGFNNASAVEFGGERARTFTVNSPTSITAVTPSHTPNPAFPLQTVEVNVITPGYTPGLQEGGQFTYENPCTVVEGPSLSGLEPSYGPATGGTHVTLSGYDLGAVSGVTIGGQPVPFTLLTSSTILVTTPPGKGSVEVRITSPPVRCGIGSRSAYFTYESIEQLTFSKWPLAGSLTPKPLGQAITLPSGSSFNGSGELNTETNDGTVTGNITVPAFKATPKLFGLLPVSLGMTVTQSGAISGTIAPSKTVSGDETLTLPAKLNLDFTSIGLLGLNIPTKCQTSQPVSLTLTDTLTKEALLSKGWSFSGTATIAKITCEGGLLGSLYGETLSGLISGTGATYSLTVTAPGG